MILSLVSFLLIETRAGSFFDQAHDLNWFHVCDFGDSTLHDQKVWVVDIELDRAKQVPDLLHRFLFSIDEVLGLRSLYRLVDPDQILVNQSWWGLFLVGVVKYESHGSFLYT